MTWILPINRLMMPRMKKTVNGKKCMTELKTRLQVSSIQLKHESQTSMATKPSRVRSLDSVRTQQISSLKIVLILTYFSYASLTGSNALNQVESTEAKQWPIYKYQRMLSLLGLRIYHHRDKVCSQVRQMPWTRTQDAAILKKVVIIETSLLS